MMLNYIIELMCGGEGQEEEEEEERQFTPSIFSLSFLLSFVFVVEKTSKNLRDHNQQYMNSLITRHKKATRRLEKKEKVRLKVP